ncbi:MAG: PD-(D/E)XK nuclease family protein [bacterium]
MVAKRLCYLVKNPLDCLHYARELVFKDMETPCIVVLPRYIEPSLFESYLLEQKKVLSGVDVYKISSLASNVLSHTPVVNNINRVDQVALSEYFEKFYTRGITRTLLNSILELKNSLFERSYIEDIFSPKKNEEYSMLLDVFKKYEDFLALNGFMDDADIKRLFIDILSDPTHSSVIPENTKVIFVGFAEYTSSDLMLIDALSKKVTKTYLINPDIFVEGLDYSRVLQESLRSMDFELEKLGPTNAKQTKLFKLNSLAEEVHFISKSISKEVKASVYTTMDLDLYYSMFKYFRGENVSARTSIRLDRSKILSMLMDLLKMDLSKLFSYPVIWEDYKEIRILMSFLSSRSLYPNTKEYFLELYNVDKIKKGVGQVLKLYELRQSLLRNQAVPKTFVSAINQLLEKIGLKNKLGSGDKFELSTVENLIYRVSEALDNDKEIGIEEFCSKIMFHAEENYLIRGLPFFTYLNISPIRLITSNTTPVVWFAGMNADSVVSNPVEDPIIKDSIILALRSDNFIKPTSLETKILEDKILSDSVAGANVTFISNKGDVYEPLVSLDSIDVMNVENDNFYGYFVDTFNSSTVIKDYKLKDISSTSIETYIECPYRYFVSRVLKIRSTDSDDLTPPMMIQGQIAHSALEKLLPAHISGAKVDVELEVKKIISEYENSFRLTKTPANKVWANRISIIIENILRCEKDFFDKNSIMQIYKTEQELRCFVHIKDDKIVFNMDPNGLAFYGKTDRVDINKDEASFYIVDYKKSLIPKKQELEDGRKVQLLFYLAAASLLFSDHKPSGAFYVSLAKASSGTNPRSWKITVGGPEQKSCINLNRETFFNDVAEILSKKVVRAISGMKAGVFTIDPIVDLATDETEDESSSTERKICTKCEYKGCCGVKYWY